MAEANTLKTSEKEQTTEESEEIKNSQAALDDVPIVIPDGMTVQSHKETNEDGSAEGD
jgi:hypothetical protein